MDHDGGDMKSGADTIEALNIQGVKQIPDQWMRQIPSNLIAQSDSTQTKQTQTQVTHESLCQAQIIVSTHKKTQTCNNSAHTHTKQSTTLASS